MARRSDGDPDKVRRSVATSVDGTQIAYDTRGAGPGVVLLSGSVVPPEVYDALAKALAPRYTVHVVHRRGRGASGPQGAQYSIERETEDALAVLEQTGSARLLGHSFGGLVALQTALRDGSEPSALTHVVAYEPPISVDGSLPLDFMPAFNDALTRHRPALALTLLNRGLHVGGVLDKIPAPLHRIVNAAILRTIGRGIGQNLPTVTAEATAGTALDGPETAYASLDTPTLLLVSQRGPDYFKQAARAVTAHMPAAELEVVPGLDHNGPMFAGPKVASIVEDFLSIGHT